MIRTVVLWLTLVGVAIGLSNMDGIDGQGGFALAVLYGALAGWLTVAVASARGWWD